MSYVLKIISELGAIVILTLTFIEAAMEFSTTQKGKTLLKHAGYEYLHKRSNMDGSEVWRCIVHKQARCPAILKSSGNQIIREPNRHTHQTDLARSKARGVVRSLKSSVETHAGVATRQVVCRAIAEVPEEVLAVMPRKSSLMKTVQRERRNNYEAAPNPRNKHFEIPQAYRDLIFFDSGPEDENRILLLGHQDLIQELNMATLWFVDGTFDVAPSIFSQLYTFHCKVGSSYPPCLYALLPNKDGQTYYSLLHSMVNLMQDPNPSRILLDFEMAAVNNFREVFPNALLQGCYFHLNQCLVRKVQNLGLKRRFDEDMEYKLKVKSMAALSFVPADEVAEIFNQLTATFPNDEATFQLLGYFSTNWINGLGNRGPRFPVALWNQMDATAAGGPRTTNCCEGWHNSLNSHFLCQHPSVWKLFDGLKEDIAINRLTLAHAQTGVQETRPKKYTMLAQRIREAVNNYPHEQDKLRYLRRLAALQ